MEEIRKQADEWLARMREAVEQIGLPWIEPSRSEVGLDLSREEFVLFESWHKEKKLSIYIDKDGAEYIRMWGAALNGPMFDGEAEHSDVLRLLYQWLYAD